MEKFVQLFSTRIRKLNRTTVLLAAIYFCTSGSALALPTDGLLGVQPTFPQIEATSTAGQGVVYNSLSRTLTVISTPTFYFPTASTIDTIVGGLVTLIANFDAGGNVSGGTFSVTGTTNTGGLTSPLLLGTVFGVGLENSNSGIGTTDRGDFLITATGGSVFNGPDWPAGADLGATLTIEGSTYDGSLDVDWIGARAKMTIGPVAMDLSEPTTLSLMGLGFLIVLVSRRSPLKALTG